MNFCTKCIEINRKLRQSPQYKGLIINVCTGEIVMDNKIDSTRQTAPHSACETCKSKMCLCNVDNPLGKHMTPLGLATKHSVPDENFEYHLVDVDLSCEHAAKIRAYSVLDTRSSFDKTCDKITDGFIYVCVLFMQTFEKVYDKIVDSFKKAYKEGRM